MPEIGVYAAVLALYSLVSQRLTHSPVTAPMVFVGAGLLFGWAAVDGGGTGTSAADGLLSSSESALLFANVTLAILLFADSRRIVLARLRKELAIPGRLLLIGLPLGLVLGGLAAVVAFDQLDVWEALLLASIVAPTDLALGQAVLANKGVPAVIRDALNLEGGLNDGLALPFFTVFIAFAVESEDLGGTPFATAIVEKLGYGIAGGAAVGIAGGVLLRAAIRRGLAAPLFQQLALVALAVLAWWATEEVHGSGFIAAFVGGAAFAYAMRGGQEDVEVADGIGEALMLGVFFLFGASVATELDRATAAVVIYAVLTLTLVRTVPVVLSLLGLGLDRATVAYLAWFGPRGLATVVFALLALTEEPRLPAMSTIVLTANVTVLISVYAHGLTAAPLSAVYARRVGALAGGPDAAGSPSLEDELPEATA
jgi:NhaP-type Na+/H+ or K+/H+ antiporter